MIERIWTGHRSVVVAVSAIVVVAILATGLLIVVRPGGTTQASGTPSATRLAVVSPSPTDTPTATPSPSDTPAALATPEASPTPASDWVYADLDGALAPKDHAHRLPMAIMVDDHPDARPQSGFSSASIVYQAPADGDADRYMMVFQEGDGLDIGPVRSARPYFVYWAAEYKALFGHFGGDAKTLQQVIPAMTKNIYNMDDLTGGGTCPYHRIDTRAAPHNAYTNTAILISCIAQRHYAASYQGLPVRTFRDDTPLSQRPATQTISIAYPMGAVGYTFDPTTDSYRRSVTGHAQTDLANGQPVMARNIVVLFQVTTIDPDSEPGHARPMVANVGTGKAIVFLEGQAVVGTWKKASNTALTRIYDSSGAEIPLVRGEIYIQSVAIGTGVTYK